MNASASALVVIQFFDIVMKLSTLLQEHITSICSCGDITVTVTVTCCTDNRAVYNIQITGAMTTKAALSLITSMVSLINRGL